MIPALAIPIAKTSVPRLLTSVFGMYVAPVILLTLGVIPFRWRFYVLVLMAAVAGVQALRRDYSRLTLGLRAPRLAALALWAILPSVVALGGILLAGLQHRFVPTEHLPFYTFYILILAPAQEFLYRSFLFAELASAQLSPSVALIASSSLYGFMHVIHRDVATVVLTFLVGLIWGWIFLRTRNLAVVVISHALLGVATIMLGAI